jgi:hypothetical protein
MGNAHIGVRIHSFIHLPLHLLVMALRALLRRAPSLGRLQPGFVQLHTLRTRRDA